MIERIGVNSKFVELVGSKPGKTVLILAGVHGNEVCGIQAFDRLIPKLQIERGKVYFIYGNLEAIRQNKRFVEYNLNRAFFKEQSETIKNTLEGATAREIIPYLEKAEMMLDLHASNSPESKPFIICEENSFDLAYSLPAQIVTYNFDAFEQGSTLYYINLQKKIGAAFECGFLGDPKSQEKAEQAILSFLRFAGAISGEIKSSFDKSIYKIVDLYKNKKFSFKKSREFSDFELLNKRTLIGKEGEKEVYREQGELMLFVRDRENIDSECFLVARDVTKDIWKETVKYTRDDSILGEQK